MCAQGEVSASDQVSTQCVSQIDAQCMARIKAQFTCRTSAKHVTRVRGSVCNESQHLMSEQDWGSVCDQSPSKLNL